MEYKDEDLVVVGWGFLGISFVDMLRWDRVEDCGWRGG